MTFKIENNDNKGTIRINENATVEILNDGTLVVRGNVPDVQIKNAGGTLLSSLSDLEARVTALETP